MAVVLKTTEPGRVPGVRIPLPPPNRLRSRAIAWWCDPRTGRDVLTCPSGTRGPEAVVPRVGCGSTNNSPPTSFKRSFMLVRPSPGPRLAASAEQPVAALGWSRRGKAHLATSVDVRASAARRSGCDRAVRRAHVRKLIPGFHVLEAVDRVAADREKRQRACQLVPEPFELLRRLEIAIPAEGGAHVADDRQTTSRSIRDGQAQLSRPWMISARRSLSGLPGASPVTRPVRNPARRTVPVPPAWQDPSATPAGAERRQGGSLRW